MICFFLSFLIFVLYLIFALRYSGKVPPSLSETYYILPGNWRHCFTGMMWSVSFLLLPVAFKVTAEVWQFLIFLALAAICFVGAAPEFHEKTEGRVHTISAYIAAALGIAWALIATKGWPWLALSFFGNLVAALVTDTVKDSRIFWLEMVAFATVYLSIFYMII